ncbi:ABC transporter ATP-binding protein [Hyphobacterium sp.]|uniref:ABC transporter ATP-binding protein n=1 Tax=Hyphobacterium sp. TaxID=2004662 RepID=UPI003BA8EBD4
MSAHFRLEEIVCRYGEREVLSVPALEIKAGKLTAIVGPNGAGKSTLIRTLAGLLIPASGEVYLEGVSLDRFADRERARRIAYLPADSRMAWPMLAQCIVELGRHPFLKPLSELTKADEDAVRDAMDRTGTAALSHRPFDQLSSGEKARILLARALATQADALLLDEPGAALDPRHQLAVMEMLVAEAKAGRCVVFAGHSLELVHRFADRVLVLEDGKTVADGTAEQALSPETLKDVFGLSAPDGIQSQRWDLA